MTSTTLVIRLEDDEIAALRKIAKSRRRNLAQQAEVLILAGIGMAVEKAGGHHSRWTNEDLAILRERTDLSDTDLGILLGRTGNAVSARRYRLGTKKHVPEAKK